MLRAHVFELTPGKVAVPRAKAIVPEGRMRVARHEVPGMTQKEAIRPAGTG